jgi:phosphoglycolate phosphatase
MKLILFDCDGTIVDSQHVIVAAMEGAFAQAGMPAPSRGAILNVVGLSLVPAVARLLPDGADAGLAAEVAETYKKGFQTLRRDPANHEPLYPGARAVILALAARDDVILGVATGKSRRGVDVLFEREGLGPLFSTIQTADDHPSKPDPSMILRAMAETSVAPDRAVMIGDTTYDMNMACAAGVAAVGVAWGYHPVTALIAAGAEQVVTAYGDLPPALDGLFAARSGGA